MSTKNSRLLRSIAAITTVVVLAAACGSSDDDVASTDTPATTVADSAADSEASASEPADEADEMEDEHADDETDVDEVAVESVFPVTIGHKYGEITIEAEPVRVVSVGFSDQDLILSLGVVPVGIRDWYGDQPDATWPWAQDELGGAHPMVLSSAEIEFEAVAALNPDLIVGVSSGMTKEDYDLLNQIAPTLAQSGDFIDYGMPWEESLEFIGLALGKHDEALALVDETHGLFAAAAADHPEFAGAEVAVAFSFDGEAGGYASGDNRPQTMSNLGFATPVEFDALAGDNFYFSLSDEELAVLDRDVIIWLGSNEAALEEIRGLTLRPTLNAYAEGREIVANDLVTGAFSFASPLSFAYFLDEIVPELVLALDGDPATAVPSAAALDPDYVAGESTGDFDDDQQAAADAWSTVFDSETSFEDKAPHLENAASLEGTIAAYGEAGAGMGGIALEPVGVEIDGDAATVTYDVLFGGTAAYEALSGDMSRVDGTWTVSEERFCSFMTSARTPCA